MPLVRIDVVRGRDPRLLRAIADAIHRSIVREFGIPEHDRFQILAESAEDRIIAEDAGLGFGRSEQIVMIQIFTQRGRSTEAKQRLYAAIASDLGELGIAGEDVFIGYVENSAEDWSFGFGRAQYLTGELTVPEVAA